MRLASALVIIGMALTAQRALAHEPPFTKTFVPDDCGGFSSSGANPFFILQPGYTLTYQGQEDGKALGLTITVLSDTEMVDGVETRVVEENETKDGQVVEISRNFMALCNRNNSVIYFGEDVDIYENGVVVSHDGAWRSGVNGAHAGVLIPGVALIGARYFQEVAPGVAMDRAEIISLNKTVQTPAGTFQRCLKTVETSPLDPGSKGFKYYAPGIGLVRDGPAKLVSISN